MQANRMRLDLEERINRGPSLTAGGATPPPHAATAMRWVANNG